MAFNITGFVTLTNTVPQERPNPPMMVELERIDQSTARLTWTHEANPAAPHTQFRIESFVGAQEQPGSGITWETYGTAPAAPVGAITNNVGSYSFDLTSVQDLVGDHRFRIVAVGEAVGDMALESMPSAPVTLVEVRPNIPQNVTVSRPSDVNDDLRLISWEYTHNFGMISHFELQCYQLPTNSPELIYNAADQRYIVPSDQWRTVADIPASLEGNTDTTDYEYSLSGFLLEDEFQFYRVNAVFTNGSVGSPSAPSNPAIPLNPDNITDLSLTRISLDQLQLSWDYPTAANTPKSFIIEISEGSSQFTTLATLDGSLMRTNALGMDDPQGLFRFEYSGVAAENDTLRFRVRVIGQNNQLSGFVGPVQWEPVQPRGPETLVAEVNSGVGLVTSVSLAWTPPSETTPTFTTPTSGFVLEYRLTSSGNNNQWEQIGVYSPDVSSVEIIPPQQGAIDVRLYTQGLNGLTSLVPGTLTGFVIAQLVVTPGSATDDAIYNGDAQFIANDHFSVDNDDFCLQYLPTTDPQVGLIPDNIEGGTFVNTPTERYVDGRPGEDLVIEWRQDIQNNIVNRRRHFYLNLTHLIPVNNPTRKWDVDTGNVIVEVISNPTLTNRMYETATDTTFFYHGPSTARNDPTTSPGQDRIRFLAGRATGAIETPMYVSRVQIRLSMRRVFTFRATGVVTIRITFLADSVGHARVPIPLDGVPATNENTLCFEAFASELTETAQVSLEVPIGMTTASTVVRHREIYETTPMVQLTPTGPCIVWATQGGIIDGEALDGRAATTIHMQLLDVDAAERDCLINYTIRGY